MTADYLAEPGRARRQGPTNTRAGSGQSTRLVAFSASEFLSKKIKGLRKIAGMQMCSKLLLNFKEIFCQFHFTHYPLFLSQTAD